MTNTWFTPGVEWIQFGRCMASAKIKKYWFQSEHSHRQWWGGVRTHLRCSGKFPHCYFFPDAPCALPAVIEITSTKEQVRCKPAWCVRYTFPSTIYTAYSLGVAGGLQVCISSVQQVRGGVVSLSQTFGIYRLSVCFEIKPMLHFLPGIFLYY